MIPGPIGAEVMRVIVAVRVVKRSISQSDADRHSPAPGRPSSTEVALQPPDLGIRGLLSGALVDRAWVSLGSIPAVQAIGHGFKQIFDRRGLCALAPGAIKKLPAIGLATWMDRRQVAQLTENDLEGDRQPDWSAMVVVLEHRD